VYTVTEVTSTLAYHWAWWLASQWCACVDWIYLHCVLAGCNHRSV